MPNNNSVRSSLPASHEFPPEFGARHPIDSSRELVNFFRRLDSTWSEVLPKHSEGTLVIVSNELSVSAEDSLDDETNDLVLSDYHVYDDPDHLSLTVVDQRLSKMYARKRRIRWSATDAGRIITQVDNEIAKLNIASPLEVKLTQAVRLADADSQPGVRRLGLMVEQSSTEAELLVREHEIVMNGLGERLKGFRYPNGDFVPTVTIGRFNQNVQPEELDDCVARAQGLLPLRVKLEPLQLFAPPGILAATTGKTRPNAL